MLEGATSDADGLLHTFRSGSWVVDSSRHCRSTREAILAIRSTGRRTISPQASQDDQALGFRMTARLSEPRRVKEPGLTRCTSRSVTRNASTREATSTRRPSRYLREHQDGYRREPTWRLGELAAGLDQRVRLAIQALRRRRQVNVRRAPRPGCRRHSVTS